MADFDYEAFETLLTQCMQKYGADHHCPIGALMRHRGVGNITFGFPGSTRAARALGIDEAVIRGVMFGYDGAMTIEGLLADSRTYEIGKRLAVKFRY